MTIGDTLWNIVLDLFGPVLTAAVAILAGTGIWLLIRRTRRPPKD